MKTPSLRLIPALFLAAFATATANAQVLILADDYNVTGSGSGFALDSGVNSGINPPGTRLTGLVAPNLRYFKYNGAKANSAHTITDNQFNVARAADSSTITLTPGTGAYDFSSALRSVAATPELPSVYEIRITMSNASAGTQRASFALSSDPGAAGVWDFGLQIHRTATTEDFFTLRKRIDGASHGGADVDGVIGTTAAGTWTNGSVNFLVRVTDAGTETIAYSSRVQVSIDNGVTWLYDSVSDTDLAFGFRFDTAGRYLLWDIAGNSGPTSYDDFSLNWLSGPAASTVQTWTGAGPDNNWSTTANWDTGTPVANGDKLIFNGTTRLGTTNDLTDLAVPWLMFDNGGFELGGNPLTVSAAITNAVGQNTLSLNTAWASASAKSWHIATDTRLILNAPMSIEVLGNHTLFGGGTLVVSNNVQVGSSTTANPALEINDGRIVFDGPLAQLVSRAGYRIGVGSTATTLAETVLTNGASIYLNVAGAGLRVGDVANAAVNRLAIHNSTLTMSGGDLGLPWTAGATGEVVQVGGVVSGCDLNFNQSGAGVGTYSVHNGVLEPRQIARNNPGGSASIIFENAILRTYLNVVNPFMAGLDQALITSGGLTIDATTSDVVLEQPLSGPGGLTKTGGSAAILQGTNTYAGATIVQAGKLVLPTVQTNAAAIQVAAGAELGVAITTPGSSLTTASLTLAAGSAAPTFDLGPFPNPTAPLMQVGTLSASGMVSVNITGGSLMMVPGTITLIKYSNLSGAPTFTTGSLPPHLQGQVVLNAGSVDLIITGVQGFRWTGALSSDWDTFTQNWISGLNNAPSAYQDGFKTEFLDGAVRGTVTIAGAVTPALIHVDNTALAYSFSGGTIATGLLRKNGTNTLTRPDGGADQVTALELNEGYFVAETSFDADFSSTLTDTSEGLGTLAKTGPGLLAVFSTNSTYDGHFEVREGTLRVGVSDALGSTNGTIVIRSGASLDVNDIQSPHKAVIVSGIGHNGQGAITELSGVAGVQHNLTDVTMVGDTTFGCANGGRWDIRVRNGSGVGPGLRGNGFNFTKVGGGAVSISAQRHAYGGAPVPYWEMELGDIFIKEGSIALEESISLGNPARALDLWEGTTMNLFDLGWTNPLVRNITITNGSLTCGGQTTHTNVVDGNVLMSGSISIRPNNASLFLNGILSGDASVTIGANPNPGRVILNGTNTYTGDTTVTNSTLAGNGSVAGNLTMTGGSLAPGDGIGAFTIGGSATLAGTIIMELAPGQTPNSDRLVVAGTLSFAGDLVVVLAAGASAPDPGDVFELFNKAGVGAFANISLPALRPGLSWDTSALALNGTIVVTGSLVHPSIGSTLISGDQFVFTGTGGVEGSTYYVLTATDVAAPLAGWSPVATNVFGPGGAFAYTNTVSAEPGRFFRLQIP